MRINWSVLCVNVPPKATSFRQFEKGEKLHDMLEGFLGTGIFNSDGGVWKFVSNACSYK